MVDASPAATLLATPADLGAALWLLLDPYRVTSHGQNPWTLEAVCNVLRIRAHIDAAVAITHGRINSCYRSPVINAAVGGATRSRHMEALAVDIAPGGIFAPGSAAELLWRAAQAGKLGAVQQVIQEPTWVHIGWRRVGEPGAPQRLLFDGTRYLKV